MSVEFSGNSVSAEQLKGDQREQSDKVRLEKTMEAVRAAMQSDSKQVLQQQELTADEIAEAAESFADLAQNMNRDLRFSINNELDQPVIRVIDRDSGDIIRQIPSEEVVELAVKLRQLNSDDKTVDSATGLLIDSRV